MIQIVGSVFIGTTYEQNDDRALINDYILYENEYEIECETDIAVIVCDGVGGNEHGGYAAELVVSEFSGFWQEPFNEEVLVKYIENANSNVITSQKESLEYRKMATTIAGVKTNGDACMVFNIGDSRVYRYRKGYVAQLTHDHSAVQEMLDFGMIDSVEASNSAQRNIITKSIGSSFIKPFVKIIDTGFVADDVLIVCTDGLSDFLNEEDIEIILKNGNKQQSLQQCCRDMVELAIEKGSNDNISVILIKRMV